MKTWSWVGSSEHFVDKVDVQTFGPLTIGRYGGNSSAGQYKNEDGCLIWYAEDWELVVLLDAHQTAESAALIVALFEAEQSKLAPLLQASLCASYFTAVQRAIIALFQSPSFLAKCRAVSGETACLIAVRKGNYISWLSIGDCMLYVLHPELVALGQYMCNTRHFYEWIGQVNTFAQPVPCYSAGVTELRQGSNRLFMTTDGLTECPNAPYAEGAAIDAALQQPSEQAITDMLQTIQANGVRDSTTIVCWHIHVATPAMMPSDA